MNTRLVAITSLNFIFFRSMSGQIPRDFIEQLLARIDIVDLIDKRVKLKKAGKNYSACCPFHNEKTPSFSVSQEKQFYHCFGCGVHGNAIDFMMEYERLAFPEAIEELASFLGVSVPREQCHRSPAERAQQQARSEEKRSLYDIMTNIAQFYHQQLTLSSSRPAVDYLQQRGLSKAVVEQFSIGYVADEWDLIRKNFGQNPHNQALLISSGMLIQNEAGHCYDRFRGRIMFPIRDRRGRVIGFGGRIIGEGQPKYLNSPETPLFQKGKELYGLYEVLQKYRQPPQILVVEGYMDVVALAQYGIDYAVASLGTATTGEHLQLLFRQTHCIICCYDGDRAGRDAAWRALENALGYLKSGNILKFLFLPDGEDPDSYVRTKGSQHLATQIQQASPLSEYLFDHLIENQQLNLGTVEGKSRLRTLATELIQKIPDAGFQQELNEKLEKLTGFMGHGKNRNVKPTVNVQVHKTVKRTPMREVIALLLQNPDYAKQVPDLSSVLHLEIPGLGLLAKLLEYCRERPNVTTGQLLEHWRNSQYETQLFQLARWEIPLVDNNLEELFLDSLDKIFAQCVEKQIENLQAKERSVGLSTEEKKELVALMLELKA